MRQLLDELHRAHETNREAVWKEAFPEGSRSSLPDSGEAAEAMPAAGMPGLPRPGAYQHSSVNEFHTTNSDVVGKNTKGAPNPQRNASVLDPDDTGKICTMSIATAVMSTLLTVVLFCVLMWKVMKAKKDADREAKREYGGCPLFCDKRTRRCSSPESCIQQQLPLLDPGNMECPLSSQSSQSSSPSPAALHWWDQPESELECAVSLEPPSPAEPSPAPLQQQDENNGIQKKEAKSVRPGSPQPQNLPNLSSSAPQQQNKPSVLKRLLCCKGVVQPLPQLPK
ncbi:uncharacterized protein LOC135580433 [Columba livia]|uniref:uncharacterized protein LOC135580433 n=1 Tax=Columba livia TaxID=8932 RepID=UPI0031B9B7C7